VALLGLAILLGLAAPARAETPVERSRDAALEQARARMADQIQLSAYDLVDELVYGWTQEPVFDKPTRVVLAQVGVPVGLGTGLQALVENHLSHALIAHPRTRMRPVHCPACTQVVVHSGPRATVVARGIDSPEAFEALGIDGGMHALFVDLEAEGSSLVLRARLTRLSPDLPIVWSRTLTTSSATPALLRDPDALVSAEEAREQYLDALRDRGPVHVVARLGIRTYARPDQGTGGLPPPPFPWLQIGIEAAATPARDWMVDVVFGGSFIPQAYQGLLAETRILRLVTGRSRSHVRPDLYAFFGAAVMTVWGPATGAFQVQPFTTDDLIRSQQGEAPRSLWGSFEVGLDLRLGNRLGVAAYLETLPALRRSQNLGEHVRVLGIGFQSLGTEVVVCF